VGDGTILDAIVAALQTAAEYDKNDQVAPAVVLWTDKAREWEPVLSSLRGRLPLLTLGSYAPDSLQGPAIWLRCALPGVVDGLYFADGRTPVIYLPGIGREDLKSVADLDPSFQPLAELQYRGVFWTHPNGRDWTIVGFLRNKDKGLGLGVKENAETLAAVRRALAVLLLERVPDLSDRELDAADFNALLQPDSTRSLLRWLDDPAAFRQAQSGEQWAAFLSTCKKEWDVDPETDGELSVAEQLGRRKGAWAKVWERFAEAPEKYPGVPERLRAAKPQVLMPEHPDSWPQVNEDAEADVRRALGGLGHAQPDEARAKLRELEGEHGKRREWLWACVGRAPLANALEHLVALAEVTGEGWKAGAVADIAGQYAQEGWRADDAVLKALAAVDRVEDIEAVKAAADVLYRVWLEQGAKVLQTAAGAEDWPAGFDSAAVPPGTCVLFSDGLRYDLGGRLSGLLGALGCECEIAADMSALPPITSTAKPAVSPVARRLGTGPDFDPMPIGGSSKLTAELLRKLIREAGWQVLEPAEGGDPSGRAWTELGDVDEFGHSHGWKLARAVDAELREIAQRVAWLLKYGWQRVVVVTDHGWLLVPGGLDKETLHEHLAEKRKGRCARVKGTSSVDYQTLPWRFDPAVRVAFAPGISTFVAGQEYDHGGLSPQECVVPRLTVTRERGPASAAVEIESVTWVGMRCRVQAKDAPAGLRLDLRTKAGDAGSTLLASPQAFEGSTASALVEDDEQTGSAALVVLIDEAGAVIKQAPTVVGGDA
jgi:hypothetical protein